MKQTIPMRILRRRHKMLMQKEGILLVVSGPAGSGKGTIVGHLLNKYPDAYVYSVSATTRPPRVMEQDGVQYYFLSKEAFEERIEQGQMLEYAQYCGNYYGTPKQAIVEQLSQGKNVILEIEVQGALNVKHIMPEALLVMVLPPDFTTLEKRLRGRGTNTEEDIQNRLRRSREELKVLDQYDYVIVNDDGKSEEAAETLAQIVKNERYRIQRNPQIYHKFFEIV